MLFRRQFWEAIPGFEASPPFSLLIVMRFSELLAIMHKPYASLSCYLCFVKVASLGKRHFRGWKQQQK